MTVSFILGRAGSGKTRLCLEQIKRELLDSAAGPPLILLVPEQATFQMERQLAAIPELECISRAQVLSFGRLAHRIMQEAGGAARPHISDVGKSMVIRAGLARRQGELRMFSRTFSRLGVTRQLVGAISECKQYDINPEQLTAAALKLGQSKRGPLADKMHDLSLVFADMEQCLRGRYTDPDDYLRLAVGKMPFAAGVQGAKVWIDGFSGFTAQEYLMLAALIKTAAAVNIALCLPAEQRRQELKETDVFHITWSTYHRLHDLVLEQGRRVGEIVNLDISKPPRFANSWLAHLEAEYPRWPGTQKGGEPSGLRLVSAANRRAEVEAAARQIIDLVRERGYHWREISVMCRSLEPYIDLIGTIFHDYGIPVFIDQNRPVTHHPLVELLRSSLETAGRGWRSEVLFRCLKTDLFPLKRGEVDMLENYCLAHGIQGASLWYGADDWCWSGELDFEQPDRAADGSNLQEINRLRRQVAACMEPLATLAGGEHRVEEISRAVWHFLSGLEVQQRLGRWCREAEDAGMLEHARMHVQVWNRVMDVLDELVEVFGAEQLSLKDYLDIMEAALEQLQVGLIPPGLDQVLVGNIERSRNPDIKALFLVGVSEGVFPLYRSEDQMFTDAERELLASEDIELAPTSRTQLFQEQYLIYISLTRAAEYLWLSWPLADEEGKEIPPSPVISRLQALFPGLQQEYMGGEPDGEEQAWQYLLPGSRVYGLLAAQLREVKRGKKLGAPWLHLYHFLLGQDSSDARLRRLMSAPDFSPQERQLPRPLLEQLHSFPLKVSVSRLEQYYRCPFSYFAQYILGLKERRRFTLDAINLGKIYHQVLAEFVKKLKAERLRWREIGKEQQEQMLDEVLAGIADELKQFGLLRSANSGYLMDTIRENLLYALEVLREHACRGQFEPQWVEISFGRDELLEPVELILSGGGSLLIHGRVDRVDLARYGGRTYIRIIDYKSRATNFDWWRTLYGLQLQLLTYLWLCTASVPKLLGEEVHAAGAFYFPVGRPLVTVDTPLNEDAAWLEQKKQSKMKGVMLRDRDVAQLMGAAGSGGSDLLQVAFKRDGEFAADKSGTLLAEQQLAQVLKFIEFKIREAGEKIISGKIDIRPYRYKNLSPCSYCDYKTACWFDTSFSGCSYNVLLPAGNEDVLSRIAAAVDGGEE